MASGRQATISPHLPRRRAPKKQAAGRGASSALRLGIGREITGRERNRVLSFDRCLAALNEGTSRARLL